MSDKRSVHTDALETLGTIIGVSEARDAIHLAVEPVIANGYNLEPGDHVGRYPNGKYGKGADKKVGIVDPFLERGPQDGERFWLVIYPRQITSLRHVWAHPDFDPVPDLPASVDTGDPKAVSMAWIANYALSLSGEDFDDEWRTVTANELIEHAKTWVNPASKWGGDYLVKGGLLEGVGLDRAFWDHFEVVTGLKAPDDRPSFFSCSC